MRQIKFAYENGYYGTGAGEIANTLESYVEGKGLLLCGCSKSFSIESPAKVTIQHEEDVVETKPFHKE